MGKSRVIAHAVELTGAKVWPEPGYQVYRRLSHADFIGFIIEHSTASQQRQILSHFNDDYELESAAEAIRLALQRAGIKKINPS